MELLVVPLGYFLRLTLKQIKEENKLEYEEVFKIAKNILEEKFKSFVCKKNNDVQDFLRKQSIDFQQRNIARTYLIFNEMKEIVAYYTLAFKHITMKKDDISSRKRNLSGAKNISDGQIIINTILIAQLARNDSFTTKDINIKTIMNYTMSTIEDVRELIGTSTILIEVDNEEKLVKNYEEVGFSKIDSDEELTQLMKIDINKK